MKRIIGLLALICTLGLADVLVHEANFPDEAFRNIVETFDTDGNGKLSDTELAAVTEISCEEKRITSLKGIEFFESLETLRCDGNRIDTLILELNQKLTLLSCKNCNMKTLDVSSIRSLKTLQCDGNLLYNLNFAKNNKLEYLSCSDNNIGMLDTLTLPGLRYLDCSKNRLIELNVYCCKNLEHLCCNYNFITEVDVSRNRKLTDFDPEEVKKTSWGSAVGPALYGVAFDRKKATVKQEVTITAESFTDVTKLTMYAGSKAVQSWEQGYTDSEGVRTWKVTYAFRGAGERELTFRGFDQDGKATETKKAAITVTSAPVLTSVKFGRTKATVKQNVAITAVTSTNTTKLTMYAGKKAVRSWTGGWTDRDGKRTWKVTSAYRDAGERTVSFRATDANGYATAAKTAAITITKAPVLTSVKFGSATGKIKQDVTIVAVTSTNTAKLTMYNGTKAVKSWTEGYTDRDGKRTWKVTYAFSGAGIRTMGFKATDANGCATAAKEATIEIKK